MSDALSRAGITARAELHRAWGKPAEARAQALLAEDETKTAVK